MNMKKFKVGDFVYDIILEEAYPYGFTALKIIGFNDQVNKYYCLVYDEVSLEPYTIYLINEKQLDFIKDSKYEKYIPKDFVLKEQGKEFTKEMMYEYPIYDVDGTKFKLVRNAIHKSI